MIFLIAGGTHTGKTRLAQRLVEVCHFSCLSIDHLKMGLIRSGYAPLTPEDDDETLTAYLWPVVREMVKTAIENEQHLIIEGCYIPFDWQDSFTPEYRMHIRYLCLILSEGYIRRHFADILRFADTVERRQKGEMLSQEQLITENEQNLLRCRRYGCDYHLITDVYDADTALLLR